MKKISCIVPAYNEATRILPVLDVLLKHPLIDEVIVINDASSDGTKELLNKVEGIVLVNNEINKGKTKSILTGLHKSKNDTVILIDSDLIGLSQKAITDLIDPVLKDQVDITISLRKNALSIYHMLGIDFVSGERVFEKKILLENEEELLGLPGFGLEVFINNIIISKNLRVRVVGWPEVISPRKSAKLGFFSGSWGDFKMIIHILRTVSLWQIIYQNYKLRKLSKS